MELVNKLEDSCVNIISNCLLDILSNNEPSTEKKTVLSEMITNNFENTGTNKKVKLELTWTWRTVIQELKDDRDISKQFSWSVIILNLIELDKIPFKYLKTISDFIANKVNSFNQNSAVTKSSSKRDSLPLQMVYFRISHELFNKNSNLHMVDSNSIKTANFFLNYFNRDKDSLIVIQEIVQSYQNLDINFYKVSLIGVIERTNFNKL